MNSEGGSLHKTPENLDQLLKKLESWHRPAKALGYERPSLSVSQLHLRQEHHETTTPPSPFIFSPPHAADRGILRSEAGIVFCIVVPRFYFSLIAQRVVLQLYLLLHCHIPSSSGLSQHPSNLQSTVVLACRPARRRSARFCP